MTTPPKPQQGQAMEWQLTAHLKLSRGGSHYCRRCEAFGITWLAARNTSQEALVQEFSADHLPGRAFPTIKGLLDAWDDPVRPAQGEPYRPSNSTEGDAFSTAWCERCQRGDEARAAGGDCGIFLRTCAFSIGDDDYPTEWQHDANGMPSCLAFIPLGDPVPLPPCRHTADLFPTTKGPTMTTPSATTEHLLPDPVQLQSSQLASMAYADERQLLEVLFTRGGLYRYADVPAWKVERVSTAGIRGVSTSGEFRTLIRDAHPTSKHNPATGEFEAIQPAGITKAQLELARKLVKKCKGLGQRLGDGWDKVQLAAGTADNDAIPADKWLEHLSKAQASLVIEHLKAASA